MTLMSLHALTAGAGVRYSAVMPRKKRSDSPIARYLAELRRSNAAGKHGRKKRDRYNDGNKALGQEKRDNHGE